MAAAEVISGISLKFWRMTSLQAWSSNILMDLIYTWILCQGKICRQFRLLTFTLFIGQFVHPVGGDEMISITIVPKVL